METNAYTNHRLQNLLQTLLLIGGMLGLVGLLGYLLGGTNGLVWAGLIGSAMMFLSGNASPRFLLRLLNARPLHPDEAPSLYSMSRELARRAGLPRAPQLFIVRQPFLNAFAVGTREAPAIGVTEGLVRKLDYRDLVNILAHEISHIRNNDLRVMSLAAVLNQVTRTFAFFGQVLLFVNLPLLMFGRSGISWFAILLLLAAPTLSMMLQLALSRTREFDADLGAVRLTGDAEGMATALKKLETYQEMRFWGMPYRVVPRNSPFSTHPPTAERIARLREMSGLKRKPYGYVDYWSTGFSS